jgi:hypothetical protein
MLYCVLLLYFLLYHVILFAVIVFYCIMLYCVILLYSIVSCYYYIVTTVCCIMLYCMLHFQCTRLDSSSFALYTVLQHVTAQAFHLLCCWCCILLYHVILCASVSVCTPLTVVVLDVYCVISCSSVAQHAVCVYAYHRVVLD